MPVTLTIDRPVGRATRSEVIGRNGMVCSSQPLCSQIGLDILKKGGNAIDAAIATNAALGLMEPMSCGIGGDLFAIIYVAEDIQLYGLESFGRSPQGLSYDQLKGTLAQKKYKNIPMNGPLSVSTPGCVSGWFEMNKKFGKLKMADILAPTIEYCKNGFPVTEVIANDWKSAEGFRQVGAIQDELLINGDSPKKGDIFKNVNLAATLEQIAHEGKKAFYEGKISEKIIEFMSSNGGFLTKADFRDHKAEWVDPIYANYRGYDIFEMPLPGQGASVLQMMKILETFDLSGMTDEEKTHVMIETKKIVYEDRAKFYGDSTAITKLTKNLLSEDYAKHRASLITEKSLEKVKSGYPDRGDTVYLTTADKFGNVVSFIQSIYHGFGSQVVVPGTGFALQSRGCSFSMDPNHPNCYAPGKRPFHTIIPGFVMKNRKPFLSFGVMGGDMQPQGHVQILSNIIDRKMSVQEAGDAPRWRHIASTEPTEPHNVFLQNGGFVLLESGLRTVAGVDLKTRGHRVLDRPDFFGGYQAIRIQDGVYYGASESRKDGQASGY